MGKLRIFLLFIIVLSIVFFVYGSIKLSTIKEQKDSIIIDTEIPGVIAKMDSSSIDESLIKKILTISTLVFILSFIIFIFTFKKQKDR